MRGDSWASTTALKDRPQRVGLKEEKTTSRTERERERLKERERA